MGPSPWLWKRWIVCSTSYHNHFWLSASLTPTTCENFWLTLAEPAQWTIQNQMSLSRQFLIEIFKTSSDRRFPWWRWRRWRSWIFYIVIKRPNFSVCGVPNFHKRKYWIEKQCKEQSKNKQLLEWNIWARRGDDTCSSLGHICLQHAAMLQIALSNFDRMYLYVDIDIHNLGSFKNFWFFENTVEVLRTSITISPHLIVNIYVVQWCQNWITLAAELQWLDHWELWP